MSNDQSSSIIDNSMRRGRSTIQAVVVDNFRVIYQADPTFRRIKAHFVKGGLKIHETAHFLVAYDSADGIISIVHRLSANTIDNNIAHYILQELVPSGFISSDQAFGAVFVGIVTSIVPDDPLSAWGYFSLNTLQRLREQLDGISSSTGQQDFITSFAAIYRRLFSLKVGSSLLDVGCACAFWPVLVAECNQQKPGRIVGVDNRPDAINLSAQLAALTKVHSTEFMLADMLAPDFQKLGEFDTVTAIHVLEHLSEACIPQALSNLLRVTRQRLLIAVPYEDQPEVAYGHQQVFNREKLEAWGEWCLDQLDGKGSFSCEDVQGGLLMIERHAAISSHQ